MNLTEQQIERRRESLRKHFRNPANQHKQVARRALGHEVRMGRITPPSSCEKCGAAKVEAHHEDYGKPLDVMWLCRRCHKEMHRKTHCNHGHELTPENIYTHPATGKRRCRQCRHDHVQTHYDTKGKFERKAKRDAARILGGRDHA